MKSGFCFNNKCMLETRKERYMPLHLIGAPCDEVIFEISRLHPSIEFFSFGIYRYNQEKKEKGEWTLFPPIEAGRIHSKTLSELRQKAVGGWKLFWCSKVLCADGTWRNIPMMQSIYPLSEYIVDDIKDLLLHSDIFSSMPGVLLDAGRFFYYIGMAVLNNEDWLKFLGECLMIEISGKHVFDPLQVGRTLVRQASIIRISPDEATKMLPKVMTVI
jgi:hypothetical protein